MDVKIDRPGLLGPEDAVVQFEALPAELVVGKRPLDLGDQQGIGLEGDDPLDRRVLQHQRRHEADARPDLQDDVALFDDLADLARLRRLVPPLANDLHQLGGHEVRIDAQPDAEMFDDVGQGFSPLFKYRAASP